MTVESNLSIWGPYLGNDVATAFPYTNVIFSATHLVVVKKNISSGAVTTLVLSEGGNPGNYSVSGINNVNGGNVVLFEPLPTGYELWIFRIVDVLQLTDFKNQGAFHAQFHEDAFDWGTMVDQQLQEQLQRTLLQDKTTPYRNLILYSPTASGILRYRADLTGVESVGLGSIGSGVTAALTVPGIVFASSSSIMDTNASKFAWDNTNFALDLLGTARYRMAGGVYTPQVDGNVDFAVLTAGSTKVPGSSQGLRRATWSFFDTNTTDIDNAVIAVNVLSLSNPTPLATYKKTGIHVNAYTLPDNGGDCSGILALQTGGGNALSAFKFNSLRPVGQTDYQTNGYAIECGMDTNSAVMLMQVGFDGMSLTGSHPQGLVVNMNTPNSKGIVFQPVVPAAFDNRICMEIAQYTPGATNIAPVYQLSLAGVQVGNQYSAGVLVTHYELGPNGFFLQHKANDANSYTILFQKDRLDGDLVNSDVLHDISINGRTGGSQKQLADWFTLLSDATGGSEDVIHSFRAMMAGTLQTFLQLAAPADTETSLIVLRNIAGALTMQRVFMGAADSGGAGYKLLRVVN